MGPLALRGAAPSDTREERLAFELAASLNCPWRDCGAGGCLFNLTADPTESVDLARHSLGRETSASRDVAALLKHLRERLRAHNRTVFSPDRGINDLTEACNAAKQRHNGFWGPFAP